MTGTDTTAEQWATIPGFDGVYEVSSVGNVRNVVTGRMLKPRINHRLGTGYRQLTLKASPERRSCYVHALVLEAFVGPRPAGMHVRHLNGNSLDNRLENLRWGTPAENAQDRVRHGTDANARKTHCLLGHPIAGPDAECTVNDKGQRKCRVCNRIATRRKRGWSAEDAASVPLLPRGSRERRAATHCKNGHEFTPQNTYVRPASGKRVCRTCRLDYMRNYKTQKANSYE